MKRKKISFILISLVIILVSTFLFLFKFDIKMIFIKSINNLNNFKSHKEVAHSNKKIISLDKENMNYIANKAIYGFLINKYFDDVPHYSRYNEIDIIYHSDCFIAAIRKYINTNINVINLNSGVISFSNKSTSSPFKEINHYIEIQYTNSYDQSIKILFNRFAGSNIDFKIGSTGGALFGDFTWSRLNDKGPLRMTFILISNSFVIIRSHFILEDEKLGKYTTDIDEIINSEHLNICEEIFIQFEECQIHVNE